MSERLERQNLRYAEAVLDGRPGMAAFQLARMQLTKKQDACCSPYPPARHTRTCPTVTHARLFFADEDSGLTECGTLGPISDTPNCEGCVPIITTSEGAALSDGGG